MYAMLVTGRLTAAQRWRGGTKITVISGTSRRQYKSFFLICDENKLGSGECLCNCTWIGKATFEKTFFCIINTWKLCIGRRSYKSVAKISDRVLIVLFKM